MGQLKPGATYIYERHNDTVYAREFGDESNTRVVVGWDYDPKKPGDGREMYLESQERILWKQIREAAKTNIALQTAIDNVKILYHLGNQDGK